MLGNVLVTGTRSGIGRYIHEQLGGTCLTRQSGDLGELKKRSFDMIVHCAWNNTPTRLVADENLVQYYEDNVLLTQELLKIPHSYFIFFSTVDIYPSNGRSHLEGEVVYADSFRSIHATTKMISEGIVRAQARNFLILRPTSLAGPYMRRNNIVMLLKDSYPHLTLDSNSIYNLITYLDVLCFILGAIKREEIGVFNLASSKNITLERMAELVRKDVTFGVHHYEVGNIINRKAAHIQARFNRSSEEVLDEILNENKTA